MLNEALVLLSEVVLSAYPSLIKLVDASVTLQTGLRMAVYAGLALLTAGVTGAPLALGTLVSVESLATGLLNLLHVGSSYTAFDQLAGGNAMALFYTFPVWNILGAAAVFGERLEGRSLPWIGLALLGAILLAQPSTREWTAVGVMAALVAALTESGIYLWFKTQANDETNQPWTKMTQMFGGSLLLWVIGIVVGLAIGSLGLGALSISGRGLSTVLLFNALVGFTGYALRFYLIPKVSTVVFSALSFFGIIAAYVMGWGFSGEIPTPTQGLGALAIVVANAVLLTKNTV